MSVRARVEAELDDTKYSIDPSGSHTRKVEIRGDGIERDEVASEDYVEDVIEESNGDFTVWVSASSPSPSVSSI